MGHAIIGNKDGVTFIQCMRGDNPLSKIKSVVKDRQGNEWNCRMAKIQYEQQQNDYHVEVYDEEGKFVKKFMKEYLTFVKEK